MKNRRLELEELQHEMLRAQQGLWHRKGRAIIVFEGFDAAGKGGCIRHLTAGLDPRSFKVHPIGPPTEKEQGTHYLYRFWKALPEPGTIAIFDRSWYGRVLVERVEGLTPKKRWQDAYREINEFERMLVDDGIVMAKVFLKVSKKEQLRRLEERLADPYKRWKIGEADLKARSLWNKYSKAAEEMLRRTSTRKTPWQIVPSDDKHEARIESLRICTDALSEYSTWMRREAKHFRKQSRSLMKKLKNR